MNRLRLAVGIANGLLLLVAAGRITAVGWDSTTAWIFAAVLLSVSCLVAPKGRPVGKHAVRLWRTWRDHRSAKRHEPFNI